MGDSPIRHTATLPSHYTRFPESVSSGVDVPSAPAQEGGERRGQGGPTGLWSFSVPSLLSVGDQLATNVNPARVYSPSIDCVRFLRVNIEKAELQDKPASAERRRCL